MPAPVIQQPRPLLQWIKGGSSYLVDGIRDDGPIGAIGASVVDAPRLDRAFATASERGLGVAVDTEPHRVQLDPAHPQRRAYRASGLDWLRGTFVPETTSLAEEQRVRLATLHRDRQAEAGASIFLWSGHHVRDGRPLSPARLREVQVAAEFLRLCRSSGAGHASAPSGSARRVAIGLSVDARDLTQGVIVELAAAYAELEPDLFWVGCVNFSCSGEQYIALRYLARRLQRESGRPCLLTGVGSLWEGALRNQIAAACQGWGRGMPKFPPVPPPAGERNIGYGIAAFHPAIRGVVPLGARYESAGRALYQRHPCPCGSHPRSEQPVGQRERLLHNRYWAEMLGEAAVMGDPALTTRSLKAVVDAAERMRRELRLARLPRAWREATRDPSDGERIIIGERTWRAAAG